MRGFVAGRWHCGSSGPDPGLAELMPNRKCTLLVAGFSTLVVSKVSATGVDFGGSTANTSVSAGDQEPGNRFQLNNLVVTTVAIQGSTAILRLRPA